MPTFNAGKRFRLAILALLCLFELPCCLSSISRVLVDEEQLLLFYGTLLNDMGSPIPGAQIQFWQTDQHGQYDHPQSASNTESLDPDFQYFGTATTLDDGSFWFRTQRPGLYTQRPVTHIHFKVWVNGVDILTSQFYFADENTSFSSLLQLELEELVTDDSSPGSTTYVTNKTIVVASGLGGDFGPLTPSQPAGPFYPVVDFFSFDSDLLNITTQEINTGTPAPSISASALPSTVIINDHSQPSALPSTVIVNDHSQPSALPSTVIINDHSQPSAPPTVVINDHSQPPTVSPSDSPPSDSPSPSTSDESASFSKKIATNLISLLFFSGLLCFAG